MELLITPRRAVPGFLKEENMFFRIVWTWELEEFTARRINSAYVNNMLDVLDGNCPDEYIYVGF